MVGLTGGIGSGKTTVAKMFEGLGIPVYIADIEAKKLMVSSKSLRKNLIKLLGEQAYQGAELDREYVAKRVFDDEKLLSQLNGIVHPKVQSHFNRWSKKQKAPYCIKEAAILFESGGYKECDFTILVTAPLEIRINRLMIRDQTSMEQIRSRMEHQWSDEKKIPLADYVIHNVLMEDTSKQVVEIHSAILKSLKE